tara:strand:- start:28855 stop:29736 length:882 start_codon:yes stop_codon:yes gene_type:complete
MKEFRGTGVALITPFTKENTVDFEALERLVTYQLNNGIDYLVVQGTTGEPATLTANERAEVRKTIVAINNGKLPLVLGIGGNHTQGVLDEIKATDLAGFDAILSVAPYYNKPTQEGFYQHFKAIAEATSKPIILYNVPGRTAKNVEPNTILRLASDFSNIIGVKEAGNDMHQYLQLIKNKPEDFLIISGDDDLVLGVVLAGGAGVISVIGQAFPKEFSQMIALGLQGKASEAYQIHYDLMEGIDLIFEENNPAGVKALLKKINICETNVRLPLVEASEELQEKINNFVTNLKN